MPRGARYANRIDLLQGTLDLIILQTLRWGPQHGYAISQAINAHSREAFKVETGSLYPALHRLEKRGWVAAEWGVTEHNQRAKIYRLTPAGTKQLSAEQSRWTQFVSAMASLMKPRNREA
jgi:transcriptional regulator